MLERPLTPILATAAVVVLAQASPAGAAATVVTPAFYDATRQAIVIPYVGPAPHYRVGTLSGHPPRAYVDVMAAPGILGVYASGAPERRNLLQWIFNSQDVDTVRLTMTFAQPSRVTVRVDAANRRLLVHSAPIAKPRPTPTPSAVPTPRPLPTATPMPQATPTPRPTPSPSPIATPTPKPPEAVASPIAVPTPRPFPSVRPTPQPSPAWQTPEPLAPEASPEGSASPVSAVSGAPLRWEARADAWLMANAATSLSPTVGGELAAWMGPWGLSGSWSRLGEARLSGQRTPFFQAGTNMVDLLLRHRFTPSLTQVVAGYRGLGQADVNYLTLGAAIERPLAGEWLWLRGQGLAGHNLGRSYLLDGRLSLGVAHGPYSLDVGVRHLLIQGTSPSPFQVTGPTASASVKF